MNELKFRRQFLFSAHKTDLFEGWNTEIISSHYLYVHPDCEHTRVTTPNADITLIGHIINPHVPDQTTSDIVNLFTTCSSPAHVAEVLYSLVGRFVLIIKLKDELFSFMIHAV